MQVAAFWWLQMTTDCRVGSLVDQRMFGYVNQLASLFAITGSQHVIIRGRFPVESGHNPAATKEKLIEIRCLKLDFIA
jgi:hypothetical protein